MTKEETLNKAITGFECCGTNGRAGSMLERSMALSAMESYAQQEVLKGKIEAYKSLKYSDKILQEKKEPTCSILVLLNMKLDARISELESQLSLPKTD